MTLQKERESKPRGPYKNGLKKRRQIVEAATVVFGQFGYHGGSLRTIAEMVGTTPATLVSYFTSKELLLVAVLENWSEVSSQAEGEHGLSCFRANIPLMGYHLEHPGLIQLFLTMSTEATQPDHPARPFILQRQELTRRVMTAELQRAIDDGDVLPMTPEVLDWEVRLMVGVLDGVELAWITDPTVDLQGIVRYHVDEAIARWTGRPIEAVREDTDHYLELKIQHGRGQGESKSAHAGR